jgi:hypothetical protein
MAADVAALFTALQSLTEQVKLMAEKNTWRWGKAMGPSGPLQEPQGVRRRREGVRGMVGEVPELGVRRRGEEWGNS